MRVSAKITAWRRNYLVLVYVRFWALNLTTGPTQSVVRIFARNFIQTKHAMEHREAAGPEK